jgi:hypothetical protein
VSNLNKAFIRSLRVKITHYRLTKREFFSQYLIRLNPRHIFYKTINYKHFFNSTLTVQIVSKLVNASHNSPSLNSLSNYVSAKQFFHRHAFMNFDFTLQGVYTFLNLIQTGSPVDGYCNMTRRRRALVRRR